MLTLTAVKASSELLTTVSAIAAELGSRWDPALPWERWIKVASRQVLAYCDAEKLSIHSEWEEKLPGSDGLNLVLSRRPILQGTGISPVVLMWDGAVEDFEVDADAGMLYREAGWPQSHVLGLGMPWAVEPAPTGEGALIWTVTYQAGYVPAGAETGVTMPEEIEQAAIEAVKARFLSNLRDPLIKSETVGELAVTFATGEEAASGLPATARALLEAWR